MSVLRSLSLSLLLLPRINAQDPFEIHVFEYEPLPRGAYTYEAHLNFVPTGTTMFTGPLAPTQNQLHFSSEVTAGLSEEFRAALVLMTALRPDQSLEFAGWRFVPHLYAPQSWHLPLNLGLAAEFSFQQPKYLENAREIEIRPIVEKHIGRLELDGNPVFGRALRGPGSHEGWVFEPAGRIGWRASRNLTPSLEYYSSLGREQIHQVFPGGDLKLGDRLRWSFGVGVGATRTGSRVILKSRFEWSFGRRTRHD